MHLVAVAVAHRMVAAVMAEGKARSLRTRGSGEELMAQADAEDRQLASKPAHDVHLRAEACGVTGPVGEHQAVGVMGQHALGSGGGR